MDGPTVKFITCGPIPGLNDLSFWREAKLEMCGGPYDLNSLYIGDYSTGVLVYFQKPMGRGGGGGERISGRKK